MEALAAAAAAAAPAYVLHHLPLVPPPPPPPAALARPTRLTTEQRWTIVVLHKNGVSNRRIALTVPCNLRTVAAVLCRYDATGTPLSGSRTGRPRVTTFDEDTNIALTTQQDVFTSPRQVRRKLDFGNEVSPRTIDRRMQESGYYGRVARHKRAYSAVEIQKRLAFANGYKDWTKEKWEKVLFSDEKCFYGKGFCGRTWVRRPKGEALNPNYCVNKFSHPVKVNVWGCFCAAGAGYTHIFNEIMDSELMKSVLKDNLIPSAELHFSFHPPEQWYLLHDNDKKFKSRLVSEFLHTVGVTTLEFPPYSPDLNPIENLWAVLARDVEQYQCDTMEELQDRVELAWNNMDNKKELLKSLVQSMPKRCKAVIRAKGWHTKY